MDTPSKADLRPDWLGECLNCGSSPIVPSTGMCGPCTFGTAEAVGGEWWGEETDSFALED